MGPHFNVPLMLGYRADIEYSADFDIRDRRLIFLQVGHCVAPGSEHSPGKELSCNYN
ncbi:hypothetical protein SAMN05720354_10943 [Nitrosospira sp. Nsp1]|nr:hypothetical protein SAMN05720354_10943 [Nitrosospira sp. Nsp1]